MKKKNIILIAIAVVVVIICILAVVIGFGSSDREKEDDDEKNPVELSDDISEEDKKSEEESTDGESSMVETEPPEESSTSDGITQSTAEETTEMETTEAEIAEEETAEEETSTERETEESTTVSSEGLNRLSYEYMIIDGKSVYVEYNERMLELFNCINAERKKAGKDELMFDKNISYVACARASQIAYEEDFESDGMEYYELMNQSSISFSKAVENIAAGHSQAESVVAGDDASWKTSITHYENMISDEYTKVGVGVDYSDSLGYIWVAIFSN